MWRWVTRGLVLTFAVICATTVFAQTFTFIGDVDAPAGGTYIPGRRHMGFRRADGKT